MFQSATINVSSCPRLYSIDIQLSSNFLISFSRSFFLYQKYSCIYSKQKQKVGLTWNYTLINWKLQWYKLLIIYLWGRVREYSYLPEYRNILLILAGLRLRLFEVFELISILPRLDQTRLIPRSSDSVTPWKFCQTWILN